MPNFSFYADTNHVQNLNGSGLGFFGSSFGTSVDVGDYQTTTFITNGAGTTEGPQVNNFTWTHPSSGELNGASSIILTALPNHQATLNVRFTHTTAIKTQNSKLRIFDRSDKNNDPSGVTVKVAEIIHPNTAQNNDGSGDATWHTPTGSSVVMDLVSSPGLSGLAPNGTATVDLNHDWYCAIACSPDSIGSKTQVGLYVETEYL